MKWLKLDFLKILSMSEKYLNVLPCFRVLDNSYQIIFLTHLHLLSRKLKFEESKLNWLYGVPVNKFEVNTYVWEHLQLGSNVHINESYFRVEKNIGYKIKDLFNSKLLFGIQLHYSEWPSNTVESFNFEGTNFRGLWEVCLFVGM